MAVISLFNSSPHHVESGSGTLTCSYPVGERPRKPRSFLSNGKTALGPTKPPIQWVPGVLIPGIKRPVREADHSPASSDEVKYPRSSTHSLTSALNGGEWSASRPGHFTSREKAPGTHWLGGLVVPRTILDAVVKRKIPSPCREPNP